MTPQEALQVIQFILNRAPISMVEAPGLRLAMESLQKLVADSKIVTHPESDFKMGE